MKAYVDELPEKCEGCVFSETGFVWDSEVRFCKLKPKCMNWIALYDDKRDDCPLKSLSDYTKQVRKEVCKEIKKQIKRQYVCFYQDDDRKVFNKILNQIQGEKSLENDSVAYRVVEFKPVRWEGLQHKIELLKQSKEEVECIMIQRIVAEDEVYNLHFCQCEGEYTIEITKENDDGLYEESFELTEEGYKKAIQKARNLFLGGKNGSQT